MPLSRQLRERCRTFLRLTEEIRYIFPASFAGGGACFVFVITDSAITLVSLGMFGRTKPTSVWGTYPRRARIGPVQTGAGLFFEFAGQQFEIDDEYASVVNAADAEISTGAGLPPDPFPEL